MSGPLVSFSCDFRPRPKGSLTGRSVRGSTHVQMRESVDPEGLFRTAVANAAFTASRGSLANVRSYRDLKPIVESLGGPLFTVTVETRMIFRFDRKSGHKLWAPGDPLDEKTRHLGVGDIEKLVRNVHDALVDAGVLADDHQVTTQGRLAKRFTVPELGQVPGVYVEVWEDVPEVAFKLDAEVFPDE